MGRAKSSTFVTNVVFVLTGAVVDVRAEFLGDGLGIAGVSVGGDLLGLDLGDRKNKKMWK